MTVRAGLHANKWPDGIIALRSVRGGIRFGATGEGTPTYTLLSLSVTITGHGDTMLDPIYAGEMMVSIGNHIGTGTNLLSAEQGIRFVTARYEAYPPGSSISLAPPDLSLSVFDE